MSALAWSAVIGFVVAFVFLAIAFPIVVPS
jgi:hypothetical protein